MNDALWRSAKLWGAALLVFTVIALSSATQSYAGLRARAPELASWAYALVGTVPFWYAKLILLPGVVFAGSRWRVNERPVRAVPLHLGLSLAFAAGHLTLGMAVAWSILPPPGRSLPFRYELLNLFSTYFVTGVVFYWVFLGTFYAIDYARQLQAHRLEARELALRASELDAQLAEARLQTLRSQLNPHFLFNALNAVGALCDRGDVHAAARMVTRIGELLRMALERHDRFTTLEHELHFVDLYLEIEQVRIGPRLTVARDVPPELLSHAVPSMLLQPLVENAVRHGVGQRPGAATLRITAAAVPGGMLRIAVEDSGPGFDFAHAGNGRTWSGVGLRNTVARLGHLYGERHSFRVADSDLGGARVEVTLPTAPAAHRPAAALSRPPAW